MSTCCPEPCLNDYTKRMHGTAMCMDRISLNVHCRAVLVGQQAQELATAKQQLAAVQEANRQLMDQLHARTMQVRQMGKYIHWMCRLPGQQLECITERSSGRAGSNTSQMQNCAFDSTATVAIAV